MGGGVLGMRKIREGMGNPGVLRDVQQVICLLESVPPKFGTLNVGCFLNMGACLGTSKV